MILFDHKCICEVMLLFSLVVECGVYLLHVRKHRVECVDGKNVDCIVTVIASCCMHLGPGGNAR